MFVLCCGGIAETLSINWLNQIARRCACKNDCCQKPQRRDQSSRGTQGNVKTWRRLDGFCPMYRSSNIGSPSCCVMTLSPSCTEKNAMTSSWTAWCTYESTACVAVNGSFTSRCFLHITKHHIIRQNSKISGSGTKAAMKSIHEERAWVIPHQFRSGYATG